MENSITALRLSKPLSRSIKSGEVLGQRVFDKAEFYIRRGDRKRLRRLLNKRPQLLDSYNSQLLSTAILSRPTLVPWLLDRGVSAEKRLGAVRTLTKTCAYCGAENATTRDHIPPQGIFSIPRPTNLLTVRSCVKCNCGESKDDEYFKTMISAMGEAGGSAPATQVFNSVLKRMEEPTKAGYRQAFIDSMEVLGDGRILATVDADRIHSVVKRIALGLDFHHTGKVKPDGYSVDSYILDKNSWPEEENHLKLIALTSKTEPIVIKSDEFTYWRLPCDTDDQTGFYVFEFYGRVCFWALVTPDA